MSSPETTKTPLNGAAYVESVMQMEGGQKPSKHGQMFGAALAKLADEIAEQHPELPPRCATCAFRAGTIPNQMAGTLLEAFNCVVGVDADDFACHHSLNANGDPTRLCVGYVLARLTTPKHMAEVLQPALQAMEAMET